MKGAYAGAEGKQKAEEDIKRRNGEEEAGGDEDDSENFAESGSGEGSEEEEVDQTPFPTSIAQISFCLSLWRIVRWSCKSYPTVNFGEHANAKESIWMIYNFLHVPIWRMNLIVQSGGSEASSSGSDAEEGDGASAAENGNKKEQSKDVGKKPAGAAGDKVCLHGRKMAMGLESNK